MTTESKPNKVEHSDEPTTREIFAEGRLNIARWQRDWRDIQERFPKHWIAIYDSGRTVVAHESINDHFEHIFQLEGLNRSSLFTWPPPRRPGTRRMPSVLRLRRT